MDLCWVLGITNDRVLLFHLELPYSFLLLRQKRRPPSPALPYQEKRCKTSHSVVRREQILAVKYRGKEKWQLAAEPTFSLLCLKSRAYFFVLRCTGNAGLVCDRKYHVSERTVYLTLEQKVRREVVLTKCLAMKTKTKQITTLIICLIYWMQSLWCNGDSTCAQWWLKTSHSISVARKRMLQKALKIWSVSNSLIWSHTFLWS